MYRQHICDKMKQVMNDSKWGRANLKFLKQFGIILMISFLGEILHECIPLPIPASIYGIVILFVCLEFKIFPVSAVRETGMFLIEIMPLLFIPAAVGLLSSWEILKPAWVEYLIITVVTTLVVMVVSGWVTQIVIRRAKRGAVEKNG